LYCLPSLNLLCNIIFLFEISFCFSSFNIFLINYS
jgi:hypothetical protein